MEDAGAGAEEMRESMPGSLVEVAVTAAEPELETRSLSLSGLEGGVAWPVAGVAGG